MNPYIKIVTGNNWKIAYKVGRMSLYSPKYKLYLRKSVFTLGVF